MNPADTSAAATGASIVIPCFNQGSFLAECLGSLHAQTSPAWHAIVVDDASTDGATPQLCDSHAGPRVTVLHLAHNHGRALARNAGIALARTEAVLSLDADDTLDPKHLQTTVPLLLAEADVGIVYTDYQRFGGRTDRLRGQPFDPARLYRQQFIWAGSLFRRSAWAATRGYCDAFRDGNEDYDFWLTLVEAGWRGVYVPEPLYRYRSHAASWTQGGDGGDDRELRTRLALHQHHREGFAAHGATAAFLAATHHREAERLGRVGLRAEARSHWREVVRWQPWNLVARWRAQ